MRALSLTYKNSPISVRESVTFSEKESSNFLLQLKEVFDVAEGMLVSTCNRTELYFDSKEDITNDLISFIASQKGVSSHLLFENFNQLSEVEAITHLFKVSLGIDSQVLGDIQISNQVKRAYQQSADLELAGPYLHRLMHTIFYANKKVVQETRLHDGNASTASVAVDITKTFASKFDGARIAVIGLGEIGQNVVDNLSGFDKGSVTLVNRTRAKAEELAKANNYQVAAFEALDQVILDNDVIISSVSANKPIIHKQFIKERTIHKLFIDLSLPRSVAKEVAEIPGVSLYNVDQLVEKAERVKAIRAKAVPDAERIIADSIKGFHGWKEEMELSPTIQKLKNALEDIRKKELARHYGKATNTEMELLETVTKNMVQKLINLPIIQLKAACKRGEAENLVEVIHDLFNLEKESVQKN